MPQFIRETPYANPLTGLSNDVIQGLLGYMKDKQRTQQMQGLASLLESTGIPKTVERAAYAESPMGLLNALTNVNRANVPLLKPETADALMTLAPVPSGANKAAMAVGRAGERYAEKVVPQIMERGGLPASLLEGMAQGSISPMDVWHGSPHGPFKKFDSSKIGTGEGAQVYGQGLYLGEARGTGEEYRKALTGNQNLDQFVTTIDGMPTDSFVAKAIIREGGKPEPFIAKMQSKLENQLKSLKKASKEDDLGLGITDYDMALMDVSKTQKIIDEASSYIGKTVKNEQPGYLYKVDLPDEAVANMLDWDKPLSEQPEVWNRLKESGFYPFMGSDLGRVYKPETIEEAKELVKAGIPGLKYYDEKSRANPYQVELFTKRGKYAENNFDNLQQARDYIAEKEAEGFTAKLNDIGTRNFVVFPGNEDLLRIKEINDRPITSLLE
jgi:hypothetical protein